MECAVPTVALSEVVDTSSRTPLATMCTSSGISQGGMFCYQAAAYRRSKDIASVVALGSPVDTLAALPMGIPRTWALVDAGLGRITGLQSPISQAGLARMGFQDDGPTQNREGPVDSRARCTTARHCCRGNNSAGSS